MKREVVLSRSPVLSPKVFDPEALVFEKGLLT